MLRASGQGAMLAVELTAAEAAEAIGARAGLVSVAASNSSRSTVLSGDRTALRAIAEELARREVFCRWVKVDVASHSPQMDMLREELLGLLDGVSGRQPRIPMHSTVTGKPCREADLDADYWFGNLRMPVLFGDQIEGLVRSGHSVFVEVSPHPILLPAVQQAATAPDAAAPGSPDITVLPSLRRDQPARDVMLDSLGALHTLGVPVDRERAATPGRRTVLPTYPWQRERYRIEATAAVCDRSRRGGGELLGDRLDSAIEPGTHYWRPEIGRRTAAIGDHVIGGRTLVPGSAYLDVVIRTAREVLPSPAPAGFEVTGLCFLSPLEIGESGRRAQITLVRDESSGAAVVRIFDDGAGPAGPVCVAEADVLAVSGIVPGPRLDVAGMEQRLAEDGRSGAVHYAELARHGLAYGPAFRRVLRISRTAHEAYVRIGEPLPGGGENDHLAHPALLDAAVQAAVACAFDPMWGIGPETGLISGGIERAVVHRGLNEGCYAHATVRPSGEEFRADVSVYDLTGEPLIEVTGVTLLRMTETAGEQSQPWTAEPAPGQIRGRLLEIPDAAERRAAIEALTAECVAAVARVPASAIDSDAPMRRLGIDSLMALELRNQLEDRFGVTLSAAMIWNHPTVGQLAPLVAHRAGIPL